MRRHSSRGRAAIAAIAALIAVLAVCAVSASASMVQVDEFGSRGSSNGQLLLPEGVAVDSGRNAVYVVDSSNRRIVKYDLAGKFLRAWGWDVDANNPGTGFEICLSSSSCKSGMYGSGAGQFLSAGGIAVNPTSGNVYVVDISSNVRINEYDSDGNFIRSWGWDVSATQPGTGFEICAAGETCKEGTVGSGDGQFGNDGRGTVAVDPLNGDVLVPDPGNNRVQRFDANGNFLGKFGSAGSGPGQFGEYEPNTLAVDAAGNIYASDKAASNRIQKFDSAGNYLSELGAPPLLPSATEALALDPASGHLFVARKAGSEIVVQELDASMSLVDTHAVGEGYRELGGMAVDPTSGRLYLTQRSRSTVTVIADAAPSAITGGAAPRTTSGARLNGWVDPNGKASTYYFEYGTDASYGAALPAAMDGAAGSGAAPVLVSRQLSGLQPSTTYHYRLVVEYSGGTVFGPDVEFTTRSVAEMTSPRRGIELISNPDKGNQNVAANLNQSVITSDGNQAFWYVTGGVPGGTTGAGDVFLASRGPSGWTSTGLIPPASEQFGKGSFHYKLIAQSPDNRRFLFFVDQGLIVNTPYAFVRIGLDGENTVLQSFPTGFGYVAIEGSNSSADLSRVVFLDPADRQLYDYGVKSAPLVSLMPDGNPPACGLAEEYGWHPNENDWLSRDGSRVFFVTAGNDCSSPPQLYVRNLDTGVTTPISTVADHGAVGDTVFIRSSQSGKGAIFISETALTADDQNGAVDVYRYTEGAPLRCLTCVVAKADVRLGALSENEQWVYASEDLSRVYFASEATLTPAASRESSMNTYVWEDGEIHFVAATSIAPGKWDMTPDGGAMVFEAEEPVTDDEAGQTRQIYRYEAGNRSLDCISCQPEGPQVKVGDGGFVGSTAGLQMSGDGSTVAFMTEGSLVPEDINGSLDVYEWRTGKLALVTDGESKYPAGFGQPLPRGIDHDGDNVTFSVADELTGHEKEGTANLYTARIGGGFPPPVSPQHCIEDSCQGPLQPVPTMPGAGSAELNGTGNPKPPRKQVKKPKKHHKKQHKKKGQKKKKGAKPNGKRANSNKGGKRNV